MHSTSILGFFGGLLLSLPTAYAGFSSSSSTNVAVYWGQNSYGQGTGSLAQQRLSYYCANSDFNIIPLAFLITIADPSLNFANAGNNCTAISGSNLFSCPQLEEDIATCQSTYGKTILLSVGGSTYTEGGFSTSAAAVSAATNIWSIFGPNTGANVPRPFGDSVIDGFDFDFESTVSNMPAFANQLRSLMTTSTASTGKQYLLTAAPQCPYPDSADNPMLAGTVSFDAIWVQFYNNYCGLNSYVSGTTTQNNFNFATWDNWAKTVSLNPNVKVFLGIPGNTGAAGSGYESGSTLASIIAYSKTFSSFGGVMIWDMSQVYANSGFLASVASDLGQAAATTTTGTVVKTTTTATTLSTVTTKSSTTTTTSSAVSTTTGTVNQWNQCGGEGWTGGTVCVAPYVCTYLSVWYSQCE
ncbi:glycoside hydrolase family 18 protein [Mollisia scopiformis]|uniref:chitinase n=1 Tax=Mollisia scopiformis TaxID=149040 RepID=A0A194XW18_MOLSC|nr:glycoside hydrolase family 18 protein [Mollisia scopiformis]KUJ23912.1 glycoside hydrolase family 18 protein [Mollisia scopiformis]